MVIQGRYGCMLHYFEHVLVVIHWVANGERVCPGTKYSVHLLGGLSRTFEALGYSLEVRPFFLLWPGHGCKMLHVVGGQLLNSVPVTFVTDPDTRQGWASAPSSPVFHVRSGYHCLCSLFLFSQSGKLYLVIPERNCWCQGER
jgi:hypothetical protein